MVTVDQSVVTDAVRTLRARGEKISVRAIHSVIGGGSFRDISRYVRELRALLGDDELASLETDVIEPSPPLGHLTVGREAIEAAEVAVGETQNLLDVRLAELHLMRRQQPASTSDPHRVAEVVQAQLAHEAHVVELARETQALQRILDARHAERTALRADFRQLQEQAHELRHTVVPSLRRQLVEARHELEVRQRDAEHRVMVARRQLASTEQALTRAEGELHAIIGDQTRG
jgi:hypothetical protein